MSRRRIGVFTATRAEYGLLRPVLDALDRSPRLEAALIVGGTHLSPRHGLTVAEIEADGRRIAARVPVLLAGDDGLSVAADMAAVLAGAARAYAELDLDAVLLLGDRTEVLAAAAAAVPLALPLIHLEGGHVTEGAADEAIRHAVTKLAALHFTAAEPYARRLVQMGEAEDRVFVVGATGVDGLMAAPELSRDRLAARLGVGLDGGFLLVAFHPETLSDRPPADQAAAFLDGLSLAQQGAAAGRALVFTGANADAGGDAVTAALRRFVDERPGRAVLVPSLGHDLYAAALRACDAVAGNSSSGVIEAPAVGAPAVNVGDRQKGRLRPPGVIDCALEPRAVADALARALDPAFRTALKTAPPPFGDGRAGRRIVEVLEGVDFAALRRKPFADR